MSIELPSLTPASSVVRKSMSYIMHNGFGGLEVACWPLVPKFGGLNLAEAAVLQRRSKAIGSMP